MAKANLLIVEDDLVLSETLADVFRKVDYEASVANSGAEAERILKKGVVDLVLLDLNLPDANGLALLDRIKSRDPEILVMMITANIDVQPAVEAMKRGAYDYLSKPFELAEVRMVVEKALETRNLKREVSRLKREEENRDSDTKDEMFGKSPAMEEVRQMIRMVAGTPRTPVLVQGESGTGKELAAKAVHKWSARADKPYVIQNCASIPEHMLESELFGHERGAFTDAKTMKKGLFEMAHPGTIFLDEISTLDLTLQPKLLRVLENQTIRRVGGVTDIPIDVRVVAAANVDLKQMVEQGTFRHDLLYRLTVLPIQLPLLRDRAADILPLAMLFLRRNNKTLGKEISGISARASEILLGYPWPGNVRELKNLIERAVILCKGDEIRVEHLPVDVVRSSGQTAAVPVADADAVLNGSSMALADMEKRHIQAVLIRCNGNKSKTSRELGISRSTLREKMKLYQIEG